jgi:hypothetical protein
MANPAPGVEFTNPKPFANVSQPSAQSRSVSSSLDDVANNAIQDVGHLESPVSPRALDPDGQNTNPDELGQSARRTVFVDPPRETEQDPFLGLPALQTERPSSDVSVEEKSSEPILKREMRLVSRKMMIVCLVIAGALMIGHHFWYNSLVNQVVGNSFEQQRTRLYVFSDTFWLVLQRLRVAM